MAYLVLVLSVLVLAGCHQQPRTLPASSSYPDVDMPLVFVERDSMVWMDTVSVSERGGHGHHILPDSLFAATVRCVGIGAADTARGTDDMVDIVLYVNRAGSDGVALATDGLRVVADSVVGYTVYRFDTLTRRLLVTTYVRGGNGDFSHIAALDASAAGWSRLHHDGIRTAVLPLFGRRADVCLDLYRYSAVNDAQWGYMTILGNIARGTDEFGPAIDRYRRRAGGLSDEGS